LATFAKLKLHCFGNGVVLELGVKLTFLYEIGKVKENQLDTPKCEVLNIEIVFAKTAKV
jgi:hypothetical protein